MILRTGEWPTPWTQALIISLPKEVNIKLCQNYTTNSLVCRLSKVTLKVILNKLKPQAEVIISEVKGWVQSGKEHNRIYLKS